jgi:hypothetical protein
MELQGPAEESSLAGAVAEPPSPERKRWWERVVELGASIPVEERAEIPRDAAETLDSYLYGWKKRK